MTDPVIDIDYVENHANSTKSATGCCASRACCAVQVFGSGNAFHACGSIRTQRRLETRRPRNVAALRGQRAGRRWAPPIAGSIPIGWPGVRIAVVQVQDV